MKNTEGHVYVLVSPICEYILIGGTDAAPFKRIREVNSRGPYKVLGPWSLYDIRQVADWRRVERSLHSTFRSKLVKSIRGQKELFATSPAAVSRKLEQLDTTQILEKPKIDRMLQDEVFARFLGRLFRSSAILKWLDMQGAWTFTLFPGTGRGRYYTINIGPHEVAFATIEYSGEDDRLFRLNVTDYSG